MKKVWNVISTVFVWLVVLTAVVMMVFTVISVNTFNRGDRDLFGYKAFIVLSDSMSATDFDAGDLVIVQEIDPTTLAAGDIITYTSQNEHNYGQNVTHKIRTLTTTPDGNPGFITYGTTNNIDDEAIVTYPFIQGKYIFAIPNLGTFFNFLKTPVGYILFILIPFLILIAWQGLNCIKAFREYKKEQMRELQREKDEIAAERKRNELMMQQLMQMQQQMQQMQHTPAQQPVQQQPVPEAQPVPQAREIPEPPVRQAPQQKPVRQSNVEWDLSWEQTQPRPRTQSAPQKSAARPQPQAAPQRPAAQPQRPAPQPQAAPQRRPVQDAAAPQRRPAQPKPQPAPQPRRAPETVRQSTVKAPVFDLPTVDHTDEDDLIAELSALCGRTTDGR